MTPLITHCLSATRSTGIGSQASSDDEVSIENTVAVLKNPDPPPDPPAAHYSCSESSVSGTEATTETW